MKKLIKLLNLTKSDNKNEAVAALRKAQQYMDKRKWTWEILLSGQIQDPQENYTVFVYGNESQGNIESRHWSGKKFNIYKDYYTHKEIKELYEYLKEHKYKLGLIDCEWIQRSNLKNIHSPEGINRLRTMYLKYFK